MAVPFPYQPIHIPDWAWQRPEAHQVLRARDIGALFRFARQYGNASQARIAAATGISQGRVNEIINGRRIVINLDVLLRIADGLHIPDDGRIAMGVAPRCATPEGLPAMSAEIPQVHHNQQAVAAEIRRRAAVAGELDVLAVRALGIIGLNDSLLRPVLQARTGALQMRVLLLDPTCPAAARRAVEIGESLNSFIGGIDFALARLREVADANPALHVAARLYRSLPVWRIIRFDEIAFVAVFDAAWEGHESVLYEVPYTPRGAFWAGFSRLFEDEWTRATPAMGGSQ